MPNTSVNANHETELRLKAPFRVELAEVHQKLNALSPYLSRVWCQRLPKDGIQFAIEVEMTRGAGEKMTKYHPTPTAAFQEMFPEVKAAPEDLGVIPVIAGVKQETPTCSA